MLESFSDNYAEARGKFLAAAVSAGGRIHSYGRDDLKGRDGEYLACDVAILGPDTAEKAALVVTGTHGAESYCGSAILHRWLSNREPGAAPNGVKVVLVHAINPWSVSYKTRTTENNVDLNRNFFPAPSGYERDNPSYDALAPFLHADAVDARSDLAAYRAYQSYLDRNGAHIEGE